MTFPYKLHGVENVVFTDFGSHASLLTYKDGNKATGDVGQSCTRKKKPMVTAARAAAIFKEMLSSRREYCADSDFFRAVDVWEWMAEGTSGTKIKAYREVASSELQFKAGVVAFGDNVTLVVDGRLLELARKGSKQANFVLAHELGHLGLNHHARGAVVKNFQLFAQGSDMANVPPTTEELEANLAAIFFFNAA